MLLIVAIVSFFAVNCFAQRQPPPSNVPPFLEKANATTQKEFENLIMKAGNMTQTQLEKAVLKWITKQPKSIQDDFKLFVKQMETARAQAEAAHQAAIARFSKEAKDADKQLTAIATDPNKTNQQKAVDIEKFLMTLPPNVRSEIEEAMKG